MKHGSQKAFDLDDTLHWVSHLVPSQGPLREFIHHNTLHAFQSDSFGIGVRNGAQHFGARVYLTLKEYREAFARGRITIEALNSAMDQIGRRELWQSSVRESVWSVMNTPESDALDRKSRGSLQRGFREKGWSRAGIKVDPMMQPLLLRIVSAYLDQGISIWQFPNSESPLWEGVCDLVNSTVFPLPPLTHKKIRKLFSMNAHDAVQEALTHLVKHKEDWSQYLLECHLSHKGWSGMIAQIEAIPELLVGPRPAKLVDLTALHLALEWGLACEEMEGEVQAFLSAEDKSPDTFSSEDHLWMAREVWQRAFEQSLHQRFVGAVEAAYALPFSSTPNPGAQLVFCIDERECSLRRHIEDTNPNIETFGAAGFFAIDALFQGVNQGVPAKYCPVNINPRHILTEQYRTKIEKSAPGHRPFHLKDSSTSLFRGWLMTQYYGLISGFRMAWEIFRPFQSANAPIPLLEDRTTKLSILATTSKDPKEKQFGYTEQEQADRVFRFLTSIGLTKSFAPLICIIGHGSTSVNNTHFAAYDCGACSGKPGAPNARAFAMMANAPSIRALLERKGLVIPATTHFLGGLHDTCRDSIIFFDLDDLPKSQTAQIAELNKSLDRALALNAKERTRRFVVLPQDLSPQQALKEVQNRSSAIFEPRPELGHATNAFTIVGRRDWCKKLFLDRRSFLNSYDPTQDPSGSVLASILAAVIPVCGGINLEYYFSRVDNDVLGAGTKLPHNAAGLVGVTNGVDSDLRTGLPLQMVEIHEPVRLLIVVEQTPPLAEAALNLIPDAKDWVDKEWVLFACIDPVTKKMKMRSQGIWIDFHLPTIEPLPAEASLAFTQGQIHDLPFCILTKAQGRKLGAV